MTNVAGVDQQRHMRSKAKPAADTDLWEAGRKTVALDNTAERDWLLGLPDKMRQCVVEDKTNLVRWLAATRWNQEGAVEGAGDAGHGGQHRQERSDQPVLLGGLGRVLGQVAGGRDLGSQRECDGGRAGSAHLTRKRSAATSDYKRTFSA